MTSESGGGQLHIFTAQSGAPSAKVMLDETTTRHLHSLVDPAAESSYFDGAPLWGDVVVLAGIGLGYHLGDTLRELPAHTRLLVLDYYKECIDHCRGTVLSSLPCSREAVCASDSPESIDDALAWARAAPRETVQVVRHPASFSLHPEFYNGILERLKFSKPSGGGGADRIPRPLLLHGGFFLQEEIRGGFEKLLGERPALFRYEDHKGAVAFESHFQRAIEDFGPDCVISVNMKGFDGNGALGDICARRGIPIVVWFVDDPHPILLHQRQFVTSSMIALCWERSYRSFLNRAGFGRVDYLPLAGDPSLFRPDPDAAAGVPLGFVGSSMGGEFLRNIRSRFMWNDSLASLAEESSVELLHNPETPVDEVIARAARNRDGSLPFKDVRNMTWLCAYVIHLASMTRRRERIGALLPAGIQLVGDPEGWRSLLGEEVTAHDSVDYRTELCSVYRRTGVNVNITSCQMPTAANQRVFDVPLAGGFVLNDTQDDLSELFDPEKELVCYGSVEELKEKAAFYAAHEEARARISAAARERIRARHTYEHRCRQVVRTLA